MSGASSQAGLDHVAKFWLVIKSRLVADTLKVTVHPHLKSILHFEGLDNLINFKNLTWANRSFSFERLQNEVRSEIYSEFVRRNNYEWC